jgi:hypothetical protein
MQYAFAMAARKESTWSKTTIVSALHWHTYFFSFLEVKGVLIDQSKTRSILQSQSTMRLEVATL